MLRKLSGKGTSSDIPLKDNDTSIYDDKRKAGILAENLWNTIGKEPANISPDRESYKKQETHRWRTSIIVDSL